MMRNPASVGVKKYDSKVAVIRRADPLAPPHHIVTGSTSVQVGSVYQLDEIVEMRRVITGAWAQHYL